MTLKKTPQWDDLRIFLEVVRQGSVNAASKRLGLDHTTVGRRVAQLEAALGKRLLDRRQDGVTVRHEAARLIKHAEYMESHARAIQSTSEAAASGTRATVRLATVEGFATCYLAPRIKMLREYDPNIDVELVSLQQSVNLSKKEADIFLSLYRPTPPGLMSQKVVQMNLYLYASPDYLAGAPPIRTTDDLARHSFITFVEDLLYMDAVRWLQDVVHPRTVVFRSTSILSQGNAARGGAGIVMLPPFIANHVRGLKKVLPKVATTSREIWLSVRQEQLYDPEIRSISRFLVERFSEDTALFQ